MLYMRVGAKLVHAKQVLLEETFLDTGLKI